MYMYGDVTGFRVIFKKMSQLICVAQAFGSNSEVTAIQRLGIASLAGTCTYMCIT